MKKIIISFPVYFQRGKYHFITDIFNTAYIFKHKFLMYIDSESCCVIAKV